MIRTSRVNLHRAQFWDDPKADLSPLGSPLGNLKPQGLPNEILDLCRFPSARLQISAADTKQRQPDELHIHHFLRKACTEVSASSRLQKKLKAKGDPQEKDLHGELANIYLTGSALTIWSSFNQNSSKKELQPLTSFIVHVQRHVASWHIDK